MRLSVLFIVIIAVLSFMIFINEYRVANMPEKAKETYYQEKAKEQAEEQAEKQAEREKFVAELEGIANKSYSELTPGEIPFWVVLNSWGYVLVLAMLSVLLVFFMAQRKRA